MKSYTYSKAREHLAAVLAEAEREGAVEIRRRDGTVFRLSHTRVAKASPLNVQGVRVRMSSADMTAIVREGRERTP